MRIDLSAFSDLTHDILSAAIDVHRELGPGLLESTYLPCLRFELRARNLKHVAQDRIPIVYKGIAMDESYRIDLVVQDSVVVEVKAVNVMLPVFDAQILTYMRLKGCPVGLLINFNVPRLMDGVKRFVNPRAERTEATEGTVITLRNGATEKNGEDSGTAGS